MLITSPACLMFGLIHGSYYWMLSNQSNIPATSGTVMLSAITFLIGFQSILFFFQHDMDNTPNRSRQWQ